MMHTRWMGLPLVGATLAMGLGCDIDESFLFPDPIEGVPGVVHLGTLEPIDITTADEVAQQVIYSEVGPTGTAELGGFTFEFEGFNGDACVFVDPELLFWNQAVAASGANAEYNQPDNVFDDGDLDLNTGFSVYYTGTPDERIGGFRARDEDALGNQVPIELIACDIVSEVGDQLPGARAGRGSPEYCTISNTLVGVKYTVVMEAFSLPFDDHRLGFGLLFTKGACAAPATGGASGPGSDGPQGLLDVMGATAGTTTEECVITGESLKPNNPLGLHGPKAAAAGLPSPSWLGDEATSWEGSIDFENAYCDGGLAQFCRNERRRVNQAGLRCSDEEEPGEDLVRCFCGDPLDTPSGGAF